MDSNFHEEYPVSASGWVNEIVTGDSRVVLSLLSPECVDQSFWSPPYYVGISYEKHLSLTGISKTATTQAPIYDLACV